MAVVVSVVDCAKARVKASRCRVRDQVAGESIDVLTITDDTLLIATADHVVAM